MVGPRFAGTRVLVTRPVDQAKAWLNALAEAGAVPVPYPTIAVQPPPSWEALDRAFAQLERFDWLIFTSASAVQMAMQRLPAGFSPAALRKPQVAAVGSETARALGQLGFTVARVPDDQRQEGLIAAFGDLPAGTHFLFPQAVNGRDALAAALRARGCEVDVVPASQTVALPEMPPLPEFDVASFASPSALEAFVARHGVGPLNARGIVVIGPTTAAAAHAHGLKPMVARTPRIEDVIRALDDLQRAAGTV